MRTYQAFSDFTAQGVSVSALMGMYAQLEREPHGRTEFTAVTVFIAFAIESYLNSIGARKITSWDELERLPWRAKIIILHNAAGRSVDWSRDPLQFAHEVFRLRDRLAHGKPERVLGPKTTNREEAERLLASMPDVLRPDWYRALTREWIVAAKERFRLLMTYLAGLYGLHESDHLMTASAGLLIDGDG